MTIRITSTIYKSKLEPNRPRPWLVSTSAFDPDAAPTNRYIAGRTDHAVSHAHAIVTAAEQRRDLDEQLMNEVHASRSRRRAASLEAAAAEFVEARP